MSPTATNLTAFKSDPIRDEFQKEALKNIVRDFTKEPAGRFLLVIPTGGGKTITAVKSVNKLFAEGVLDKKTDRVLWIAHANFLIDQAKDAFEDFKEWYPDRESFYDNVDVKMISKAKSYIRNTPPKLIVIDEAHHGAAKSYDCMFDCRGAGILGLTATPSRHDGIPLAFDRESYSIGFPDLVDRGIILEPDVIQEETGLIYDIDSIEDGATGLDALDNPERNKKIIQAILKHKDIFNKLIVYVATVDHVRSLHRMMQESNFSKQYEKIGWVTGGEKNNSEGSTRKAFLKTFASLERSIIINAGVLTEGFDDKTVNTIVMARPTRSKLVYMQAMGRGVRVNRSEPNKKAYILELVDRLPNIRYRIDNRWLFSDISDELEPGVEDRTYSSIEDLHVVLNKIYEEYGVETKYRDLPDSIEQGNRLSMLLFKKNNHDHLPILIDKENRLKVHNFFNYMSHKIYKFASQDAAGEIYNHKAIFGKMIPVEGLTVVEDKPRVIFDSFLNAQRILPSLPQLLNDRDDSLRNMLMKINGEAQWPRLRTSELGKQEYKKQFNDHFQDWGTGDAFDPPRKPWITFFAFRYKKANIEDDLQAFLDSLVNKDAMEQRITNGTYQPDSVLVRFPLPLENYRGIILKKNEFVVIKAAIDKLLELKSQHGDSDHLSIVKEYLGSLKNIPIEQDLFSALPEIARHDLDYHYLISERS